MTEFIPSLFYEQVAKDFLDLKYQKYKDGNISYGTYNKYKRAVSMYILPNVENKRITSITEMDCRKFNEKLSDIGFSSVYKNFVLNTYKNIFKHAMRYFKLKNNPSNLLEPYKKTFEEKMKAKERENSIWTAEEFNKFIVMVDDPVYRLFFCVLFNSGCRIGELLCAKWGDYSGGLLQITKSVTKDTEAYAYQIKETKNVSSIRDIGLGENLSNLLDEFKEKEKKVVGFNEDWFIFGRTRPLPRTTIDRIKDKAIKKAGVKRIRIHDFRHSHASNLIAGGVNIVAVSRRLGHESINTTMRIYAHKLTQSENELIDFVDKSSQKLLKQ